MGELVLHRAERADALADALAELLATPLPDPFAAEIVAVPAKGIERWLAQRLSHRLGAGGSAGAGGDGVCAGVEFPAPAAMVAAAVGGATGVDPLTDPWRPARAVWPLLEAIDASLHEPWCAPLAAHLAAAPRPPLRHGAPARGALRAVLRAASRAGQGVAGRWRHPERSRVAGPALAAAAGADRLPRPGRAARRGLRRPARRSGAGGAAEAAVAVRTHPAHR